MYPKNNKLPNKIGIFHYSGIGDWLLWNPAIQEIKRRSPKTKIYILDVHESMRYLLETERNINGYSILPDYSVFKNNFRYNDKIILSNLSGFIRMADCKQHWINLALKTFSIYNCNIKPKIYLKQNDEKFGCSYAKSLKNRMIILCNDTSEIFKKWDVKRWERVIKEFKNYVFVQVGLPAGDPINGALNMLGRTTLTQAISLVKYSKLVVAVDGLFNHVANIFDIPRVILWGNSNPRNLGYNDNTINIWKKINCFPRCYLRNFPTRECRRLCTINKRVPLCMLAIEESEVINAIKKILKEKYNPNTKYYKFKSASRNACLDCKHKDICNIDSFKLRFSDLFLLKMI